MTTLGQSRRIDGAACHFTVCRICSLSFLGCIIDFGRRVHVTGGDGVWYGIVPRRWQLSQPVTTSTTEQRARAKRCTSKPFPQLADHGIRVKPWAPGVCCNVSLLCRRINSFILFLEIMHKLSISYSTPAYDPFPLVLPKIRQAL